MATIKFSAVVSDVRGKIGGNVFARNKGGNYIRAFAMPLNPNSTFQQTIRNRMKSLHASYQSLSAARIQAWKNFAPGYPFANKVGESLPLSGQQLFLKLNGNLKAVGASIIPEPSPKTAVAALPDAVFTATSTAVTCSTVPSAIGADEKVIVSMSKAYPKSITAPGKSAMRQISVIDSTDTAPVDLTADYSARFSLPASADMKVFYNLKVVNTTTGFATTIQSGSIITT